LERRKPTGRGRTRGGALFVWSVSGELTISGG